MQAPLPLGNDIVDLRLADSKTHTANRRFIERVLAPQERIAPSCAAIDDRVFWAYWAAKETVYKTLKKSDNELIFSHRRFVVQPDTHNSLSKTNSAKGVVCHASQRVPVSWTGSDQYIHCLSGNDTEAARICIGPVAEYLHNKSFSTMKEESGLSDQSIVARLMALSLLAECGIDNVHIVREPVGPRQGPPRVIRDGTVLSNVDISLSHHGRYAAAAIRVFR